MIQNKTVIVCGGAGYIGSHTCQALARENYKVVIVDNLSCGHRWAIQNHIFEQGNIGDKVFMRRVFQQHKPIGVIHFAALIEVGESVRDPARFFENNVVNTLHLLDAMVENDVKNIVFSSTAAVYGAVGGNDPVDENTLTVPINPYGQTKLLVEQALRTYPKYKSINSICLRYFNACGASQDGQLGEDHMPETHLIPNVILATYGKKPEIKIFGTDYPTPDGTCVRDYIHVEDLADAHIKGLDHLIQTGKSDYCNLGTGTGYSVLDIINKVQEVTGTLVPIKKDKRREGDPAFLVASNHKAKTLLSWEPRHSLDSIIRTAVSWHLKQHINR